MIFFAEHKLLIKPEVYAQLKIAEDPKPTEKESDGTTEELAKGVLIQELEKSDNPKFLHNVLCCLSQPTIYGNIISYI